MALSADIFFWEGLDGAWRVRGLESSTLELLRKRREEIMQGRIANCQCQALRIAFFSATGSSHNVFCSAEIR